MNTRANKAFSALQQVGKSLMLPVSVLPAAGLLVALGRMLENYTIGKIMFTGGIAIFEQLPVVFAIGVAIGLLIATKVGEVIKSIIEDLVTPLLLAPVFKKLKVDSIEKLSAKGVLYGKLIARLIEFVVVALIVFLIVKNLGIKAA